MTSVLARGPSCGKGTVTSRAQAEGQGSPGSAGERSPIRAFVSLYGEVLGLGVMKEVNEGGKQ